MTTEQETLPGEQLSKAVHSLWARFVDNGHVREAAWRAAQQAGGYVGTCACGDYLVPARPERHGARTDFEARCRRECGRVVVAPGGRLARPARSSRRRAG